MDVMFLLKKLFSLGDLKNITLLDLIEYCIKNTFERNKPHTFIMYLY